MTPAAGPVLSGGPPRAGRVARSAVLVLHGGREQSREPSSPAQLAVLRMIDLYVGLRRASETAAVYRLRYRLRGWNADGDGGSEPDPVRDTRWALAQIGTRHPELPVALLGHSMGGRTGFAVAGDPRVVGVCALAPWLPDGEPLAEGRADTSFVIAHGTADRTTSAAASLRYAERLRATGASVARFELAGGRHALLDSPRLWHRFAVSVTLGLVGDRELPVLVASALDEHGTDGLRQPLGTFGRPAG